MTPQRALPRIIPASLLFVPLGMMGLLAFKVLLPTLSDPNSRLYTSQFGYPALQRLAGQPITVETAVVSANANTEALAASGESVALQMVEVKPLLAGPVEAVYVQEGQVVRQGQPLAKLDQKDVQENVERARNNIILTEANINTLVEGRRAQTAAFRETIDSLQSRVAIVSTKLQQVEYLANEGAVPKFQLYDRQDDLMSRQRDLTIAQRELVRTQGDFDRQIALARLTLRNNQLALQNALRDLDKAMVYAPMSGLISELNVHAGDVADPRTPLMTMTQDIVFKAYIDQARLNSVKLGDRADVRLVAYPGQVYTGRVIQINPTVETNAPRRSQVGVNRQYTYSVWLKVNGLKLAPGLQGYVQFRDQHKANLVIPESAVTHLSAGEGMVMVVQEGRAVVRKVKLGQKHDNQRTVVAGVRQGEQIILNARALNPGDLVHD
ncbi:MAG: efflux RND transporter periplasmic adaptor subunit [Leptolyngbyaceae cyanobacterium bins.349]|nr:efflux RND transporter periplasmic adaptor subunit [Leptolyngbyaceae cyanobacterium bins.349]